MAYIDGVKQKKEFEYIERDVPTSALDIATKTTYIGKIRIANRTAGAITLTLKDKTATPVEKYEAVSIAANSVSLEVMDRWPDKYSLGINIVASATGLSVSIEGFQEP